MLIKWVMAQYMYILYVIAWFEPALWPQETICHSVAFGKGQRGKIRGQKVFYSNIILCLFSFLVLMASFLSHSK